MLLFVENCCPFIIMMSSRKNKQKATESEIVKMLRFFGKFWLFYYNDVIINF